jgi:hypothetical protein
MEEHALEAELAQRRDGDLHPVAAGLGEDALVGPGAGEEVVGVDGGTR